GMGFRELPLFNLALLAKQGWRLMTQPSSLCSKLMKAKYYPTISFLHAPLGRAPSYSWHSIHSSRKVLASGLRWRIGGGNSVNVWHDPWIPENLAFRPSSPAPPGTADMKVKDLIQSDHSGWNSSVIRRIFSPSDVQHILAIPLSRNAYPDRLIWHHTRHGEYTTKTGYQLLKGIAELSQPTPSVTNPNLTLFWHFLWKQQLPTRIITFVWRLGKNILPLKENLARRHICPDYVFEVCGIDTETWFHAFVSCPFSRAVWRLEGIVV
ncbi:hypothetical protein M569_16225, partial [Genlisea aurea]